MSNSDITTALKENAAKVQAEVSEACKADEIFTYAINLTKEQGGSTIAAPGLSDDESAGLEALCAENGIELIKTPLRDNLRRIDTALTHADFAIAETGTLVLDSGSEEYRIATMMSNTHVACVKQENIVETMDDIHDYLDEGFKKGPAYFAFVTGPSRTADIERILAIGVHGPRALHIIIKKEGE